MPTTPNSTHARAHLQLQCACIVYSACRNCSWVKTLTMCPVSTCLEISYGVSNFTHMQRCRHAPDHSLRLQQRTKGAVTSNNKTSTANSTLFFFLPINGGKAHDLHLVLFCDIKIFRGGKSSVTKKLCRYSDGEFAEAVAKSPRMTTRARATIPATRTWQQS